MKIFEQSVWMILVRRKSQVEASSVIKGGINFELKADNIRDFKIRDYRRLDARSPMSGGLDRVRSVVACCGAKTQIKLLHYQLRTTRNCSSRIHFEDVFPKSQRWAYLLFCWWNSRWGRVCFALRCLQVDKFYLSVLGVRRIFAWLAEFRWVSCR